jgi:limonene-1,2-epoxide hydrolase
MPETVPPPERRTIVLTLAALPLAASGCTSLEASPMTDNVAVIRQFVAAWSRLNATELAGYFTDDGVYQNMPTGPVSGRASIERFIGGFIKPWTATEWDILNIAAAGDVVIVERLDRTKIGARSIDLPCCGVFEMRDGKIKVWRDYFDLQTYMKGMTG